MNESKQYQYSVASWQNGAREFERILIAILHKLITGWNMARSPSKSLAIPYIALCANSTSEGLLQGISKGIVTDIQTAKHPYGWMAKRLDI